MGIAISEKFKVWIITDARRQTDLSYFEFKYPGQVKTIRIHADDSVRAQRNWTFTIGRKLKLKI